jgi:hypothetical protein
VPDRIQDTPHDFDEVYEVTEQSFLLLALERKAKGSRSVRTGRGALLDIAEQQFRRRTA